MVHLGGHAAESQSSSSICFNFTKLCKRLWTFFLRVYEGARKEEPHIILREGLFTLYDLFLLNTSKESKDFSPQAW